MLHEIFQRHGIPPDEVYAKERRHRFFMYASMMVQLDIEAKARQK
ncbi:hypothetical protein [Paenibacillus terrae]|nr:hypothetical protein [Paenibacillus terrae]